MFLSIRMRISVFRYRWYNLMHIKDGAGTDPALYRQS